MLIQGWYVSGDKLACFIVPLLASWLARALSSQQRPLRWVLWVVWSYDLALLLVLGTKALPRQTSPWVFGLWMLVLSDASGLLAASVWALRRSWTGDEARALWFAMIGLSALPFIILVLHMTGMAWR